MVAITAGCARRGSIPSCNLLPPLRVRNYPDGTSGHQRDQKRPALSGADAARTPGRPAPLIPRRRPPSRSAPLATPPPPSSSCAADWASRPALLRRRVCQPGGGAHRGLRRSGGGHRRCAGGHALLRVRSPGPGSVPAWAASCTLCATIPAGPGCCASKRSGSAPEMELHRREVTHAFTDLTEREAARLAERSGQRRPQRPLPVPSRWWAPPRSWSSNGFSAATSRPSSS